MNLIKTMLFILGIGFMRIISVPIITLGFFYRLLMTALFSNNKNFITDLQILKVSFRHFGRMDRYTYSKKESAKRAGMIFLTLQWLFIIMELLALYVFHAKTLWIISMCLWLITFILFMYNTIRAEILNK